jgi:hypothetical protein
MAAKHEGPWAARLQLYDQALGGWKGGAGEASGSRELKAEAASVEGSSA